MTGTLITGSDKIITENSGGGMTETKTPGRGRVILSGDACPELISYLEDMGHEVVFSTALMNVAGPVSRHPDLIFCRIRKGMVFEGDPDKLGQKYPDDIIYNGCSTGKYFIHYLKFTDPELMRKAVDSGLTLVNVRQGYSRCSILPVDEDSVVTYDKGSAKAMRSSGLQVLLIRPGHVELPGYGEGFIGGAAGRVGEEILFNGDLSAHPDFPAIRDFITERGLGLKWFGGTPLTDIGSVIEV